MAEETGTAWIEPGERISWRSLNGCPQGVVVRTEGRNALVLLDNGKHVIVERGSAERIFPRIRGN